MRPIGRDRELTDIAARIGDGRRLVTVLGPGGIGKTTVARAAHSDLAGSGAGKLVVDLTRVERANAVPGTIAAQLGYPSFDAVLGSPGLADAAVLVDNCEHVLDQVADAVTALLETCPTLAVLATSRAPLTIPGESIVLLAPLDVPAAGHADPSSASVRLFCERARDAGIEIAPRDLDIVAGICRRLDGMPLPIELAATRARTMSPADILANLDAGIGILERSRYRGVPRHRSVRDTIEWSVQLLDDIDRDAFRRLGAIPGRFELDLAAALLAATPQETNQRIERLVDTSLVVVDRTNATTTYRLLEPVRAVASELLRERGELVDTRERLVGFVDAYVTETLEFASRVWTADLLPTLMRRFELIDVALRHCLHHDDDPARAQRLYLPLWGAVHQGRVDDVLSLGEAVMGRWSGADGERTVDAVATYAMGKLLCGQSDEAEQLAAKALARCGPKDAGALWLRRVCAFAARSRGDHERSAELLSEVAVQANQLGAHTYDLESRAYRAQDLAVLGRTTEALTALADVIASAIERGSILNELAALTMRASILADQPDELAVAEGRAVAAGALARSEAIDYPFGVSCSLQTLIVCDLAAGAIPEAARCAQRLLGVFGRAGLGDVRRALDLAAAVAHRAGHPAAGELAATASRFPDTNPLIVHLDLPDLDGTCAVLDRLAASRVASAALAEIAAGATAARPEAGVTPAAAASARFIRVGELLEVSFAGTTSHVAPTKGMDDLAVLLRNPGRDIHCVDLASASVDTPSTGEVIDAVARRQYEARIRDLQADIDEADANNDPVRSERAQAELDAIVDHLSAALGLNGKTRKQGGTAERARSTVTHRIRSAIGRIGELNPLLGRHLENSVTTGTYCTYQPEQRVDWLT
ncbi:MAG: ATP-binding protein [Acidimicrobiales bacterium]